ncbi:hypothetical protein UG55_1022149 [Frankia sp. EI5c]|uniref:hypothetical protein n=1 Tax=Frankia sp. EI5c TaxID=683316 RepID=UPI0007C23BFD|nr:hypothetical protein [Frankia sp. EI5c]OAA25489.1 hypothetical protein UG55_1022149 [Frankia sp. EI5c]
MKRITGQGVEHALATALPSLLGAGVFAVAFVHVHDVARWAGQPEWASWLIATTGELMAIAAIVEIRARRRDGGSLFWPVLVLVASVIFSGACNLTAAYGLKSDPGHWTPVMALWPVIAFALVAGLKATRSTPAPVSLPVVEDSPVVAPVTAPVVEPITVGTTVESAPVSAPEPLPVEPTPEPTPAPKTRTQSTTRKRTTPPKLTKRAQLLALLAAVPSSDRRNEGQIVADLAAQLDLAPGTARRYVAESKRPAPVAVLAGDTSADELVDESVAVAA